TPPPAEFIRNYELSIRAGIHFRILGQSVNGTGAQEYGVASGVLPRVRGAASPDGSGAGEPTLAADRGCAGETGYGSSGPGIQGNSQAPAHGQRFGPAPLLGGTRPPRDRQPHAAAGGTVRGWARFRAGHVRNAGSVSRNAPEPRQ